MASADYRLCDVCERKTFYDAALDYRDPDKSRPDWPNAWLPGVGDWAVLCEECAKTHKVIVIKKVEPAL